MEYRGKTIRRQDKRIVAYVKLVVLLIMYTRKQSYRTWEYMSDLFVYLIGIPCSVDKTPLQKAQWREPTLFNTAQTNARDREVRHKTNPKNNWLIYLKQ